MSKKRNRRRKANPERGEYGNLVKDDSGSSTVYYTPPEKNIKERHESNGVIELDDDKTPVFELDEFVEGISPVIHVPLELGEKIWYITKKLDTEWICVLVGYKDGIEYFIEDIVIPKQKNSGAHTLSEEVIGVPKLVGWLHSHAGISAYFSSEDEECNQRLPCSIVVNKEGEWKAQATVLLENKHEIKLGAHVDWGVTEDEEEEPEWFKEVKDRFKESANGTLYSGGYQSPLERKPVLDDYENEGWREYVEAYERTGKRSRSIDYSAYGKDWYPELD